MKQIFILFIGIFFPSALTAQRVCAEGVKDSCFYAFDEAVVNGTTGTPLGGFGCGGIKYNASKGTFTSMTRPPADAFDFVSVDGARFTVNVGRQRCQKILKACSTKEGLVDDDAIWPLHYVNMGCEDNIEVRMKGISPVDGDFSTNNMHLPYAPYEFTLTNHGTKSEKVALSLTWPSGNHRFKTAKDEGVCNDEWSILAAGVGGKVNVVSMLSDEGKFGTASVSAQLAPNETRQMRFVVAWYNRDDDNLGYYMNLYDAPYEIARHGIKVFDRLKKNAERIVEGMRASSLPAWLKNQTLNTLSAVVINSMFKKDGRVAFAEGQWTCFGTMDQMWLARHIIYQLAPEYAWRELEYWASTQMNNGQIHHDFNAMNVGDDRAKRYYLVDKNDTEHADYRNIQKWVDLNCALVISAFEAYQATGDKQRLSKLWQNVKRAAQRILDQVELYGSPKYPYTFEGSENSYDAGGNPDPYNTTLSVVTYKLMTRLAEEMGERDLIPIYQSAYEKAREGFHNRYIKDRDPFMGKHCESVAAGQALALHLKTGDIMDVSDIQFILDKLDNFYYPFYWGLGYPSGTYDEWTPYILAHYGGLMLNTGQTSRWYVMQKDGYLRQYKNRDCVFAHPLNILPVVEKPKMISTNSKSKMQYISIPAIWRNYYDIIGFRHDAGNGDLWLTPVAVKELGDSLSKGFFISPNATGTIDCFNSSASGRNKRTICMDADNAIVVNKLHLKDDFCGDVSVRVNSNPVKFKKSGSGYGKELVVDLNGEKYEKITVEIVGVQNTVQEKCPAKPDRSMIAAYKPNPLSPFETIPVYKADRHAGIEIEEDAENGKYATSCNNFDYMLFSNFVFGRQSATEIQFDVRNLTDKISEVEVVLDDTSGPVLGTCKIAPTGNQWKTMSFPIKKTNGTHDIILRFFGSHPDNLMDLRFIRFK